MTLPPYGVLSDKTEPADFVRSVTPHASNNLPDGVCRSLYVGGAGDVVLIANGDTDPVTFAGVPAGGYISVKTKAVRASGTTATAILALY